MLIRNLVPSITAALALLFIGLAISACAPQPPRQPSVIPTTLPTIIPTALPNLPAAQPTIPPPSVPPPTSLPALSASPSAAAVPVAVPNNCPTGFVAEETEGPYYKTGSPERANIVDAGVPGTPVVLTGYVFDKDCRPIAGAWLDFWQADGNGSYDNAGYKLRGYQVTNAQGIYYLQTVIPGEYPGRTEHIHVKLARSLADSRSGTPGSIITTQLYFPNVTQNNSDTLFNPALQVTLTQNGGRQTAFFNFRLNN